MLFRSTYELAFLLKADFEGWFAQVISEPFAIPYLNENGTNRNYIPDFLRRDTNELFEIKPQRRANLGHGNWYQKHAAALEYCLKYGHVFSLIHEDKLGNIPKATELSKMEHVVLHRSITR